MKHIIRMSINWKEILKEQENIVFLNEDIENKIVEIEVNDINHFLSKNNFHIEYEILMPVFLKLGLKTVGIIISPNYKNEELENLMMQMFKRPRKYGNSMSFNAAGEDSKTIYPAIAGTTLNIESVKIPEGIEMPTVENLIDEIRKVDTPESTLLVKRLEEKFL